MKILDRYIAKNFLIGYIIAFSVLIGLRVIIELFVHLDNFTASSGESTIVIIKNIFVFYCMQATLYFRDFAGMITVVAAAFSFGKMVRNGELIAVMASGVSLKRVVVPVIILAILATIVFVIDQEFIIPPLADRLVRGEDDIAGQKAYDVRFINDSQGNLLFSRKSDLKTGTLSNPTILLRKPSEKAGIWEVTGWISADSAVYNFDKGCWELVNGFLTEKKSQKIVPEQFYKTDLTPREIAVKTKAAYKSLLSWPQLRNLAGQGNKIKDQAHLYAQMQSHVTDPLINLVMLLISLPILICRDPKAMKTAVVISFAATTVCFVATFICKLMATEVFFDRIIPEFWVWLPIFIFLPAAIMEVDAMKT